MIMNTLARFGRLGRRGGGLAQRRGYGQGGTRRCPSCGAGLPTALPVCGRCRHIGRVDEATTPHELLGLPYGPNPFVVDTGELKRRFLEAQRLCHPDRWATRSEGDRDAALAMSNAVNAAYKTLLSPTARVGYVLRRHGRAVEETEGVEDTALVVEVLDTREAVEQSSGAGLRRLREDNRGKSDETVGRIADAVGRADWAAARRWAVRLRYLEGIGEAIRARAENAD